MTPPLKETYGYSASLTYLTLPFKRNIYSMGSKGNDEFPLFAVSGAVPIIKEEQRSKKHR